MRPSCNLLFLEDDPIQLVLHKEIVKKHLTEYQAFYASTVVEAKSMLNKQNFGLAIFDLVLPDQNGTALAEMMKADHRLQQIPIFIATSAETDSKLSTPLSNIVDEFLSKPLDPPHFS